MARDRRSIFRRKKPLIKAEEWEKIEAEAEAARLILNDPKFAFFREYIDNHQQSILEVFAKQSIDDVYLEDRSYTTQNGQSIVNQIRRIFRPAKKEYSHLSGEYKFAEGLMADIYRIATLDKEYEEQLQNGVIEIERSKE